MTPDVLIEKADRVLTLRLNRPDKKNAFTNAMYDRLTEGLAQAAADDDVRVILFAGSPDCFSAGNDLADFLNNPPTSSDSPVGRFMRALLNAEKPVIAAVSGMAVGIGVTLLLHCDFVYVGEKTKLRMPFVSLGACPEFAASFMIPRLAGHPKAAELLMLGRFFDAATAERIGLCNAVLPNADVEAQARTTAAELVALPPNALKVTKALMRRWPAQQTREAMDFEADHFMPMLQQPEAREAFSAFAEKRKPDFSHF